MELMEDRKVGQLHVKLLSRNPHWKDNQIGLVLIAAKCQSTVCINLERTSVS